MAAEYEIADDDRPSTTWLSSESRFLTVAEERARLRAEIIAELETQRQPATNPVEPEPDAEPEPEDTRRRSRSRRRQAAAAAAEFGGPLVPCQFKLSAELVSSLRLLAWDNGVTMSELVQRCLTIPGEVVTKCWLQKRSAG